jgi:hypothetical protein
MSEYSRFFTFFQNVIVGTEENSEEESSLERALATIESTSTMESINLVITDEISNYENSTIQTVNASQKIEVDCGSYRLSDWHLEKRGKQYTWRGKEVPYSGCVQFGCCYDIDQNVDIKLFSNNEITKIQQDEMFNSITQTLTNEVTAVVGNDQDQALDALNAAINESRNYSLAVIEKHITNMNEIDTTNEQKVVINSLSPLRCKNKCHEKPTAGKVNQYINLDIATENIINDITKRISESYKEMTNITISETKTVNVTELYIFSAGTVLIVITIYIICYALIIGLSYAFPQLAVLRKNEYITHVFATILLIIIYIFLGLIICLIRAGGIFTFKGALCMFNHT